MFRNIGSFSRFTSMCVPQISWATALLAGRVGGHSATTAVPVHRWARARKKCGTGRHTPGLPCPRRANPVDVPGVPAGSYRPRSNQAAREGDPSTSPKHELPALP